MALVLRKAVLPKNVSLLKCFKGRPLATAANKKNPAALSTAVPCRSLRDNTKMLRVGTVKIEKTKQLPSLAGGLECSRSAPLRFCVSCPNFVPESRTRHCAPPTHLSPPRTRPICHDFSFSRDALALSAHRASSSPCLVHIQRFHTSNRHEFAKGCSPPCNCGCPCPFPCGPCGCPNGCNCLPPPCNQPPKCIQYMTGYYYYPYGFWFCGPYHVTGTCTPVGPCGPCPQSCPACPCAKCCACLNPVAAVMGGPQQRHQTQRGVTRPPAPPHNDDIKYPLPTQEIAQCGSTQRSGGISKFFPFNSVPSVDHVRRLPHTSVLMCPYSTQPQSIRSKANSAAAAANCAPPRGAYAYPEQKPVYCTPCIKQSKSNFSTRPRQSFNNINQKQKKSVPNFIYKSPSDYYEKRTESRSPIHHKRSKRLICEVCPFLESPKVLMSQDQRDRPHVYPGAFQYSNIPNYKSPYPQPCSDATYSVYDI